MRLLSLDKHTWIKRLDLDERSCLIQTEFDQLTDFRLILSIEANNTPTVLNALTSTSDWFYFRSLTLKIKSHRFTEPSWKKFSGRMYKVVFHLQISCVTPWCFIVLIINTSSVVKYEFNKVWLNVSWTLICIFNVYLTEIVYVNRIMPNSKIIGFHEFKNITLLSVMYFQIYEM